MLHATSMLQTNSLCFSDVPPHTDPVSHVTGCSLFSLCPPALRAVPRPTAVLPAALQRLLQERHHHRGAPLRPQQLLVGNHLIAARGASQRARTVSESHFLSPWAGPSSSGVHSLVCRAQRGLFPVFSLFARVQISQRVPGFPPS